MQIHAAHKSMQDTILVLGDWNEIPIAGISTYYGGYCLFQLHYPEHDEVENRFIVVPLNRAIVDLFLHQLAVIDPLVLLPEFRAVTVCPGFFGYYVDFEAFDTVWLPFWEQKLVNSTEVHYACAEFEEFTSHIQMDGHAIEVPDSTAASWDRSGDRVPEHAIARAKRISQQAREDVPEAGFDTTNGDPGLLF